MTARVESEIIVRIVLGLRKDNQKKYSDDRLETVDKGELEEVHSRWNFEIGFVSCGTHCVDGPDKIMVGADAVNR